MRLTVLGSSGSAPGPDSPCSGYLVEQDGYRLLLDLGPGASMTLQRYVSPGDVDAAIVSHQHTDHLADLLQMWRLRVETTDAPLPVVGPSNLPKVLTDNPDEFTVTVAVEGVRRLGPFDVRLARVEHGECWASRIGDALCYTADSAPCPALDDLAAGVDILLAEACGFDADKPLSGGHMTAGDAARLAVRSGARLLVLTHLRPWQDHARLLDEAVAIAECPVMLAIPGLRIASATAVTVPR
jgi:ribonuclease BN (tRNA processing enzyme)